MAIKSKTASLIYDLMLRTTPRNVAQTALKAVDSIQSDRVEDQLLGIASVLICLLNQYGLLLVE